SRRYFVSGVVNYELARVALCNAIAFCGVWNVIATGSRGRAEDGSWIERAMLREQRAVRLQNVGLRIELEPDARRRVDLRGDRQILSDDLRRDRRGKRSVIA